MMSSEEILQQLEQVIADAEEQKTHLLEELERVGQARKELEMAQEHHLTELVDTLSKHVALQPELEERLQSVTERIARLQTRREALVRAQSALNDLS